MNPHKRKKLARLEQMKEAVKAAEPVVISETIAPVKVAPVAPVVPAESATPVIAEPVTVEAVTETAVTTAPSKKKKSTT